MKLRAVLGINAVVAGIFGVLFVLVPGKVFSNYGVEPNPPLNYMGQLFGAALVTIAVLTWSARNVTDSGARKSIVLALFVGNAVGFIVSLLGQLGGVVNALGWSTVAIYLLLALGFAYFQFGKSTAS